MVTVLLTGGLGNQMFQYAAGKALSLSLRTDLLIDPYFLKKKKTAATKRHFELDVFNVDYKLTSSTKNKLLANSALYIRKHRELFLKLGVYTQMRGIHYSNEFRKLKGNITLVGNFQNERFFKPIEHIIRSEFSFRSPLEGKNAAISQKIIRDQSVAIHIRRGDYVNQKNNFAICTNEYYHKALEYIISKISDAHLYIFSDEIEWVQKNIAFGSIPHTYIDWNSGKDSYKDMQLMSMCKHAIIANSTFSWWGAWLINHPDKIVMAPEIWFNNTTDYNEYKGYLPAGWIRF